MTSHSNRHNRMIRRHDLVFVSPAAWCSLLQRRDDLAGEPLVAEWVDRGWPLIARRAMHGETDGLPLGLPLPPYAGKRRLSVLIQPEAIVSTAPPPELNTAISVAPDRWQHTLGEVLSLASRHGVEARIFGSLAWCTLTGLDYLTDTSDLDLLLPIHCGSDLVRLTADIAAIEATAPMRLDGELMRDDGAGVNWREFYSGARELLVKTTDGVTLLDANLFHSSEIQL
ncbi:malonate decarboxylase holo-[acyl-carrier-protein] synthase [Bradyrhizobium sp. Ash2021]|uniref:malonate decarboxylase holo-[acyl-carrier-protein] synthase n=1 Tax=Bradyrhizobium sp. Ash2021 TaxID=2954771 RepID=UPI0028163443|nr:malonate decarboxylase holo-[acyl-carrier-protein] synthase [Bradyrhizobium sp. Ash2021]WMT74532.1 malonate decarboxylase holo-[acyl-carrier-protein] synthase [Bradyrhizobium sp. Ash2021]